MTNRANCPGLSEITVRDLPESLSGTFRNTHRTTVELLAIAHERACEAELAGLLADDLAARQTPCLTTLRARFSPDPADLPEVVVELVPLSIYDGLIEQGEAA